MNYIFGKICTKCILWQPLINFHKKASTKDGYKPRCKACELEYSRAYQSKPEVKAKQKLDKQTKKEHYNTLRNQWRARTGVYTGDHRRRERRYGFVQTIGNHYSRHDVFDRDNWICWICSEPIDPELQWPNRFSASVDHVMPLVKGGRDIIENVKASHLTCNIGRNKRKGCV